MRRCRSVGAHVRCARATQMQALDYGDPAGYCVPVGKRRTQAKGKQLSLATIVWSKAQCATRTLGFFRTRREKHNLIKILTF